MGSTNEAQAQKVLPIVVLSGNKDAMEDGSRLETVHMPNYTVDNLISGARTRFATTGRHDQNTRLFEVVPDDPDAVGKNVLRAISFVLDFSDGKMRAKHSPVEFA